MSWREILNKSPTSDQKNKQNKKNQNEPKFNFSDISDFSAMENERRELKEVAEYLFFERLGISDNEELALDEALSYITNQLTNH